MISVKIVLGPVIRKKTFQIESIQMDLFCESTLSCIQAGSD